MRAVEGGEREDKAMEMVGFVYLSVCEVFDWLGLGG